MRITWLLEVADQLWGGVKVALEDANWLARRGHQVTVLSRSGPPSWMQLECGFRQVTDFRREHLPDADVVIGTFWTTVPWAQGAGPGKGTPVHFCQGYEGDQPERAAVRERIEAVYRLPGMHHLTIAPHLTMMLHERFGIRARELRYAIDHGVHRPGPERTPGTPLRVGIVGPYAIPWKGLPTGYEACRLAHRAGQPIVLVRATNTPPSPEEIDQPFPVEWHRELRPDQMGDFYRSLDVFLGTSTGAEEGFFLPAIEAMACGVPSVLTDIPCFRGHQLLVGHDRYALFVPPNDPSAMAEAMVLAGALPDVRRSLRNGGIEVAQQYRLEMHGEQLEAALAEIAGESTVPDAAMRPSNLRLVCTAPAARTTASPATDPLPRLADELAAEATRLEQCREHERAARAFAAAHCLAPAEIRWLASSAHATLRARRPADALQQFDRLIAAGLDDEATHTGRGNALHALGRIAEAAQAFRAALAVGHRTAEAYNRLGVVLFQAGDAVGARQSFERALALDPKNGDARANLAELPAA